MRGLRIIFILGISLVVYLLGFLYFIVWDGPYYRASDLELDYSDSDLAPRIERTADWFEFMINQETGQLEYEFDPTTESFSDEDNEIRELASVWSMIELVRSVGKDELSAPIKKTLDFYLEESSCNNDYCYLDFEKAELAMNAFLVIDLFHLNDSSREEEIRLYTNGILELQNEDGSYRPEFDSDLLYGQDYYPGEAMLALMMAYDQTNDSQYLESVQKAFTYYRDYWVENKSTAFVPWQSQMGLLLFEATQDFEVVNFVFDMNDWIVENEQITVSNDLALLGAFSKDDPRIATASMVEALVEAYKLAETVGDKARQSRYSDSIRLALNYLLALQTDNGGWQHSISNQKQRIDYAQHTVLGLIKILEYNILQYEPSL